MSSETTYDAFLSYNRADEALAARVAEELRHRELTLFFYRWSLVSGDTWRRRIEKAMLHEASAAVFLIGRGEPGEWQDREFNLALRRRDLDFPIIPVLLPGSDEPSGVMADYTWVDFRDGLDDPTAWDPLVRGITRVEPPSKNAVSVACPFRGLRAFREEDAPHFFGRERLVGRLIEAVQRDSFVPVVGASGSGKSSLVQAGLFPFLRRASFPSDWQIVSVTPGERPLEALARELTHVLEPELDVNERAERVAETYSKLASGRTTTVEILGRHDDRGRVLFFVDQWEELYTVSASDESTQFITELISVGQARASVVMTVRADFVDRVLEVAALAERLQHGAVWVGTMTPIELREAVVEPAARASVGYESDLVERLLADVGREPGGLPLLEFVLTELWDRRERRSGREVLTHDAYASIGRLRGVLATTADRTLERLEAEARAHARRTFIRFVHLGEASGAITRRRVLRSELDLVAEPLLKGLIEARLLVVNRHPTSGDETLELAHETLVRHWPKLREWIEEDPAFLRWRERTAVRREDWERLGDPGALLKGEVLREAEAQLALHLADVNETERGFIVESRRVAQSESLRRKALTAGVATGGLTACIAFGGYSAQIAYHGVIGVALLTPTWLDVVRSGLSLSVNLLLAALVPAFLIALVAALASLLPVRSRSLFDPLRVGSPLPRMISALQVLLLTALAFGFLSSAVAAIRPLPLTIAQTHGYEQLVRWTIVAGAGTSILEMLRRRCVAASKTHVVLSVATLLMGLALYAATSVGHGSIYLPRHRRHEVVVVEFTGDMRLRELRGERFRLARLRRSEDASAFYCAASRKVWQRVSNEAIESIRPIGSETLVGLTLEASAPDCRD